MLESTDTKISYYASSAQADYLFPYPFFSPDDIHCYLLIDSEETELSNFSVEIKSDYSKGATISFPDPLPDNALLTIARELQLTQLLNLPEYGKIPSSELERTLDKLVAIAQQLREYQNRTFMTNQLVFGSWGPTSGLYIAYGPWSDTFASYIKSHNNDSSAHQSLISAIDNAKTIADSAKSAAAQATPPGCVFAFAGPGSIPAGWLLCDGRAVPRALYPDLFATIGETYGPGDASSTFNLPDFRGRFLRGYLGETSADIGAEQPEALPDIDVALRMDAPSAHATVKAAPHLDEDTFGNDGYCVIQSSGTDEYMIQQAELGSKDKAATLVKSQIYGKSEHVTPINYAIQWIIKY